MRVTLVTTWDTACGIAEYAYYLVEALRAADPRLEITPLTDLHPDAVLRTLPRFDSAPDLDWVWLNYHAALHSQWTPGYVQELQARKVKVGITFHDTGVPNSAQCKALHAVADVMVIHEPAEDLPGAVYLRQGIPSAPVGPYHTSVAAYGRPVVGTLGFPFPWKNYDLLAEASALAGWALLLLAPNATEAQVARWRELNPHLEVHTEFTNRVAALAMLAGCDATAFLYANANTGTSAAIRQGIAARKPVIATSANGCRQFRDLMEDPVGRYAIDWVAELTVDTVAGTLATVDIGGVSAPVVRLAEQDSWAKAGRVYAQLLRGERP